MKIDRTAFWAGTHQENEDRIREIQQAKSPRECLQEAMYLNSVAYNFDIKNPPKLDRTAFSMRKLAN